MNLYGMPYIICWNASGMIGHVIVANDLYSKVRITLGVIETEEGIKQSSGKPHLRIQ